MPNKSEDEKRVVLDSSSFKALASETRVLILKELDKKRSTASEISKVLGISVQASSEHLENLRIAGLVERADEGRKWVYFTLTEKGRMVLHPEEGKRLWVLLSFFFLVLAFGAVWYMWQGQALYGQNSMATDANRMLKPPTFEAAAEKALGDQAQGGEGGVASAAQVLAATALNQTNSTNSSNLTR